MQLLPAIDLRGGQVVRLERGDDRRRTVYDADPCNALRRYREAGVSRIHVVDLDAAFGGAPQRALVEKLARQAAPGGIQLGGGLRDRAAVEWAFAAGCERAVVTSLIVRDFDTFADLCRRYPGRMVAALDIDGGEVRLAGWTESAERSPATLCAQLAGLPVAAVLVTDISRDGMMQGPNLDLACEIGALAGAPAILSGGVRSAADLEAAARRPGIEAAIVGRALYDGSLALADAMAACSGAPASDEGAPASDEPAAASLRPGNAGTVPASGRTP